MKRRDYVAAALVAATVLLTGIVAVGTNTFRSGDHQAGQSMEFPSWEDDTVVASAGDQAITLRELRDGLMHLQEMKDMAEREIREWDADMGRPIGYLEARHNLVLEWGDDNAVLASLVEDRILHRKAMEFGYGATEEEINESAKFGREAYDKGQLDPYNQDYIDSMGADAYFEEVYPVLLARSISIDNLSNGVVGREDEVPPQYADGRTYWLDFKEKVIAEAEISIPVTAAHSATLGGVLGFLHDVRQADRDSMRRIPGIPAAPGDSWVAHVKRARDGSIEVLSHKVQLDLCSYAHADGQVGRYICDSNGEVWTYLLDGDIVVITPPGESLPAFPENEQE